VFSLRQKSLKLILIDEPIPKVILSYDFSLIRRENRKKPKPSLLLPANRVVNKVNH
jgi:hypothetical protein